MIEEDVEGTKLRKLGIGTEKYGKESRKGNISKEIMEKNVREYMEENAERGR